MQGEDLILTGLQNKNTFQNMNLFKSDHQPQLVGLCKLTF